MKLHPKIEDAIVIGSTQTDLKLYPDTTLRVVHDDGRGRTEVLRTKITKYIYIKEVFVALCTINSKDAVIGGFKE